MKKSLALILGSLILSQTGSAIAEIIPAGVKPKQEDQVRLVVYNDSSYTLRVKEGSLVETDQILPPSARLDLYMYGRISQLEIFYKKNGKWIFASHCPSGTFSSSVKTVANDSYWLQEPTCSSATRPKS